MDKNYVKVKNNANLVRDMRSKAILNTDTVSFENFKRGRDRQRNIDQMMDEHNQLKNDVEEIKKLLQMVLDKVS